MSDVSEKPSYGEDLDVTGYLPPNEEWQVPSAKTEPSAPDLGASSFPENQAPSDAAYSVSQEDDAFYQSIQDDPTFDLLLRTSTTDENADWTAVRAGMKKPEDLPEHSPVRAALLRAKNLKGSAVLEAQRNADRLGLPMRVALASPEKAHMEAMARDIEENLKFASWAAQSPENAAVARENFAALDTMFKALSSFTAYSGDDDFYFPSMPYWNGLEGQQAKPDGWSNFLLKTPPVAMAGGVMDFWSSISSLLRMGSEEFFGENNQFAQYMESVAKSAADLIPRPEFQSFMGGLSYDVSRAVPPMAAAVIVTALTKNPQLGAAVMGAHIAGTDYQKFREWTGADRAAFASMLDAILQTPLEYIGLGRISKLFATKGFGNILKQGGITALTEGITEAAQKAPEFWAELIAKAGKEGGETAWEQIRWITDQFTSEEVARRVLGDAAYEGLVGLTLGGLMGGVQIVRGKRQLDRARTFADAHKKFHQYAMSDPKFADMPPAMLADAIREANPEMNNTVSITAEELYQLAQNDKTLLANLGLTEEKAKQDAADGQIYEFTYADLHAYLLDQAQFDSIADIVRENPNAYSAKEGNDQKFAQEILDTTAGEIREQAQKSVELFQKREQDEDAIQVERMRLHQDLTQAILNVPSVREQARAYGGVDKFVNDHLTTMEREARRIAKMSDYQVSASDLLRAVSFQGLDIARYLGDNFVLENFVSPQSGKTVAQEIQGEFEESRVNREFEEASRSGFFDNIETTAPLSDFPTAEEVFRGKEWTPPQRVEKPKKTARYRASEKPVAYNDAKGERVSFRGEEITLVPDGTVLRLPDGSVTAPFKFDPNWWIHGQSGKETRALQTFYWMQQAVAQMGQEAVAEMDGTVATLERLLENGPEVSDIAYTPEKTRAKAYRKTDGKTAEGHVAGRDAVVLTSEGEDNVRYELWELDDLIPSHDATRNFQENTDTYPPDVQPRKYDKDLQEQLKVRTHASGLRPEMILTDNPDPVNGPSIVTQDGVVLGGNSRAMTMQLVYENADKNLDAYLKMLMDKAPAFGFTSEDVAKFQKPVLVRVLQAQLTKKQMAAKAMLYNETPTQALDRLAEGIGRGKRLSNESLSILANRLAGEEYTTLRDFLRSSAAKPFIESIIRDKVLEPTELNKYLEDNGALTIPGQDLVENALAGFVVTDYNVVRALRDKSRTAYNRLLRVVPYLAIAKKKGGAWDISDQLTEALRLLGKPGSLTENLTRGSLLGTEKKTPRSAKAMAYTFQNASSQAELVARFANFAKLATQKVNPLLGVNTDNTPAAAFMESFGRTVAVVDGQPVLHFEQNADRKAYEFATEHGGSGHRASMALRNISEMLEDNELPAEELERIKGYQGTLTKVKGRVDIYAPDKTVEKLLNEKGELFQFIGEKGAANLDKAAEATSRLDNLAVARDMEAAGKDAKAIKLATGWERGADKMWRYETTDTSFKASWLKKNLVLDESGKGHASVQNIGTAISPEVKKAYPNIKKVSLYVSIDPSLEKFSGGFSEPRYNFSAGQEIKGTIEINARSIEEAQNLLNHEIQHFIQYSEGFARGAHPQEFEDKEGADSKEARKKYKRVAGEVEARNAQSRVGMSMEERRASLASETEDVSREDQIILQELYQSANQQAGNIFGSTQIMSDNTYLVTLFRGANLSSIIHETAHVWFEEMERVTQMEGCPEELKADFSKLRGWVGAEADNPLNVEQKEQLARGMEAYMREGKAPADELTDIFSRFKKWLMQIYQTVLQLNVQLTDEVREVFDRMLATEEEIREVYRENEIATRTEEIADALELTGADRKAYLGAAQGVADAAEHRLTRERNADMRQRRRQYTAEAKAAVNGDKLYDLVAGLKDAPLDLDDLKANFGQDVVNALRARNSGWVRRGSGVIAEELASQYGYDSAEEMVNDLKERGMSRRKAISDYVKDKIAEYDEQHAAEDYIEDNEKIIGHLEMEGQYVAKHVGKENVPRSMIHEHALQRHKQERVFYAMQANKYRNAYRRAISAERRAILKGDFDSALLYNYQARLNFEMAAMARDLKKNLSALRKGMRKFVDNRKYDPRARFAVMALASQHGIMPWNERLADGKNASTFEEWNRDVGERGYWAEVPFDQMWQGESEPDFSNRAEYMTVENYGTLTHFLKNIVQIEQNMHRELRAAKGADLDELAQNLADTIHANRETVPVKTVEKDPWLKRNLKAMHATHSKIEVLCEALDGKPLGPLWEAIYAPINAAEDNQTRRLKKMSQDMEKLFSVYTQAERAKYMTSKQMEKAIGESITMQQRIMVALNMGNEGNLERLRNGHGWTDSQIAAIVKPLTERDWHFVESVWDYLDTFREEAFQLEEDVNGLKPERIEAQPFTVTTSDGKSMNIKGGYFPIRYANEKENPVVIPEMKLNDAIVNGLGYASLQTKQGALKQRGQVGKRTPLNLSFDVIADHAFNMIHDICYRRAVLDVAKVVQHKTFREAFTTTDGMHLYKLFLPWLQDCANEKITPMKWIDPLAKWGRNATTMMMMGLKFSTMFTQPVGLTQSAHVIGGWKNLLRGLRVWDLSKTKQYYLDACARSAFMEARLMNYDRDVRDMLKKINSGVGIQKVLNTMRKTAFTPMGGFQMFCVDLPTWWAAYDKGIKDYAGDEQKAVAYADHIVRISQGSGATKDLAAIQRGPELQRLMTMFYSYFNTLYNVAALHADWAKKHHSPADIWLTFCAAMNLWFIPALLSEWAAGRGPDDDDDPYFWAVKQWCNYPLQSIVGLREVGNMLFSEYGYQFTPAEMAPKSIGNWVAAVKKSLQGNGTPENLAKKSAQMGGYLLGLPMNQIIINTENFYYWMIGEADFRVRDLFFAKRKNERPRGR